MILTIVYPLELSTDIWGIHKDMLHWTDNGNGFSGLLKPMMSPGLKSPPWSTHQIQSQCVDPLLPMYRFAKVTIYVGFAFFITVNLPSVNRGKCSHLMQ